MLTLKNNWAPRMGITLDPAGHGRTKVFGSWGRFYAKLPNDLAARALSPEQLAFADYFDPALTMPVPGGTLAADTVDHLTLFSTSTDLVDPGTRSGYVQEFVGGAEVEARPGLSLGVRFIHRATPRVVEDVSPFPVVAYFLGTCGNCNVDYTITNPGPSTPALGDLGATFDRPVHTYNALEITASKRWNDRWSLQSSYRYSRLRGNFEGFFREDNGQPDPGITSLYDFPTNDPSYAAIGVPEFGFRGDIRFLGIPGPLPLDRPHEFKLYASYAFGAGPNLAVAVNVASGTPLTALAAHPVYQGGWEVPEGLRGSGFQTVDGFRTRTPLAAGVDAHVDYALRIAGGHRLVLLIDVFNALGLRGVRRYDNGTEQVFGSPNPDFGARLEYQDPRQVRLGARFAFH